MGEPDHISQLHAAFEDQDAIVSALGGQDFTQHDPVVSDWLTRILVLAQAANIRRIVVVGGSGLLRDLPSYSEALRHVNHDHELAFQALQSSALDWTFACPPTLE